MVFSSLTFVFLFLPTESLFYPILHKKIKILFLFSVSLFTHFSGGGGHKHSILLLNVIVFTYLAARIISRLKEIKYKKACVSVSIVLLVSVLCYYKYFNFFFENISCKRVILPIGISFFVFQAISYIIDVYRGEQVIENLVDMGMYIACFPQLVAGPIVRYKEVADTIDAKNRSLNYEQYSDGIWRFSVGICKKVLLANNLGGLADLIYNANDVASFSVCYAWLGVIAYSFQIYYDFSGYSDMAIGLGKVLGFNYLENFNYPYYAKSIKDFWNRWHMSLSRWFRDYVYIPLGGNRCSRARKLFNLFIVWSITGFWHGASWNFLLWGIGYWILIVIEDNIIKPYRFKHRITINIYRIVTLIFVNLLWVVFRTGSLSELFLYTSSLFGLNSNVFIDNAFRFQLKNYILIITIALVCSVPIVPAVRNKIGNNMLYGGISTCLLLGGTAMSVIYILMGGYNPFLYFIF